MIVIHINTAATARSPMIFNKNSFVIGYPLGLLLAHRASSPINKTNPPASSGTTTLAGSVAPVAGSVCGEGVIKVDGFGVNVVITLPKVGVGVGETCVGVSVTGRTVIGIAVGVPVRVTNGAGGGVSRLLVTQQPARTASSTIPTAARTFHALRLRWVI